MGRSPGKGRLSTVLDEQHFHGFEDTHGAFQTAFVPAMVDRARALQAAREGASALVLQVCRVGRQSWAAELGGRVGRQSWAAELGGRVGRQSWAAELGGRVGRPGGGGGGG